MIMFFYRFYNFLQKHNFYLFQQEFKQNIKYFIVLFFNEYQEVISVIWLKRKLKFTKIY
jgi:hypothetical protein